MARQSEGIAKHSGCGRSLRRRVLPSYRTGLDVFAPRIAEDRQHQLRGIRHDELMCLGVLEDDGVLTRPVDVAVAVGTPFSGFADISRLDHEICRHLDRKSTRL